MIVRRAQIGTARVTERFLGVTSVLTAVSMFVSSCQNAAPAYTGPSALESGNWTKVRKHPPTYFPKGLPASTPTEAWDGSWVSVGDQAGTRFFIPARGHGGLSARQLIDEAHAAVLPERKARMEDTLGDKVTEALQVPLTVIVVGAVLVAVVWHWLEEGHWLEEDDEDEFDF